MPSYKEKRHTITIDDNHLSLIEHLLDEKLYGKDDSENGEYWNVTTDATNVINTIHEIKKALSHKETKEYAE